MNDPWMRWAVVTALAANLIGCASSGGPAAVVEPVSSSRATGFLGDYDDLVPAPGDDDMLVYRKRPGVLAEYRAFLVDPVLVALAPDSAAVAMDPGKLADLASAFREELIEQLRDGGYEIVEEPAPGALRLRAAITDIEVTRSAVNVAGKAVGVATGVGLLIPNLDVGGASIEGEARDAMTGERILAVVDTERGRRFLNLRGMTSTGDARTAFRGWAKQLRRRLDEAHGR